MNYVWISILVSVFVGTSIVAAQDAELKEPPQLFTITIDGKAHSVELGKKTSVEVNERKLSIQLKAEANRNFDFAGVTFPYPASMLFEAENDDGNYTWTLEGNDIVMMLFRFKEEVDHKDWAEIVASEYGSKKTMLKSTTMKLAGAVCSGTQLNADVFGEKLQMEVVELPSESGTRMLVLQDMLSERGNPSAEMVKFKKLIRSNLKLKSDSNQ